MPWWGSLEAKYFFSVLNGEKHLRIMTLMVIYVGLTRNMDSSGHVCGFYTMSVYGVIYCSMNMYN